jgi:hypothetical protein
MFILRKTEFVAHVKQGSKLVPYHPHKNIMTTDRPLELLHMDLFGPIVYISIGGSKYCLAHRTVQVRVQKKGAKKPKRTLV